MRFLLQPLSLFLAAQFQFVEPDGVTFKFERSFNSEVRTCNLLVTSSHFPEVMLLKLIAGTKYSEPGQVGWAFFLQIGEARLSNGIPTGAFNMKPLMQANISSNIFSSKDKMVLANSDHGTVMYLSGDEKIIGGLVRTVTRGDYFVNFQKVGDKKETAYVIRAAPPLDLVEKFTECVATF